MFAFVIPRSLRSDAHAGFSLHEPGLAGDVVTCC